MLFREPNTHFKFIPARLQLCWLSTPPSHLCNSCSLLYCVADIARVVWGKREKEKKQEGRERRTLQCTEFLFLYFLLRCTWVTCGPCLGRRSVHIAHASFSPGLYRVRPPAVSGLDALLMQLLARLCFHRSSRYWITGWYDQKRILW